MRVRLAILLLAASITLTAAAQAPKTPSWDAWKFLIGEWTSAEAGGAPGQATTGLATFKLNLQGRVLVRTDHSEYPATQAHPAFAHDGLMIIYAEGERTRADSWDNEGHVIHYSATVDRKSATFLSDAAPHQPRFRLTYVQTAPDQVTVRFEVAPPDHPDDFKLYVEGKTRRRT